jgi:hypothetical protein
MEANTISAVNQYLLGVFRSKEGNYRATTPRLRFLEETGLETCHLPIPDERHSTPTDRTGVEEALAGS